MNLLRDRDPLELKAIGAGLLLCCALVLLAVDQMSPIPSHKEEVGSSAVPRVREGINRAVDSLLVLYGIDQSAVRTWQVTMPDKRVARMEQRIIVSPQFASVRFNHDLNTAVGAFQARVAATERVKENSVTMHIVRSGRTIRSMAFVIDPRLRAPH
jgi:hypothetical protein